MAVDHATVTVGTTPTSLIAGVADAANANYRSILLTNRGTASVFVGGPAVSTTSFGYELVVGGEVAFDLESGDVPYGVAAVAGQTVRVLHSRV